MKKVLLVVALLLLATPVFAADVTITATTGAVINPSEPNKLKPVTISYTSTTPISAFAIRLTSDNGMNLDNIRDFNVGESNGTMTGGKSGYGIFPGKFRQNVTVYNGTTSNMKGQSGPSDACYSPIAPFGDFNSGGYSGSNNLVMELGTLYVGDPNKPAASGSLFTIDVNSERGYPGNAGFGNDCNVCITVEQSRGGVVKADATAATVTLPPGGSGAPATCIKVSFGGGTCTEPNLVNLTMADANAALVAAGFTNPPVITYEPNGMKTALRVDRQTPASGASVACSTVTNYVVDTNCIYAGRVYSLYGTTTFTVTATHVTNWNNLGRPACWCCVSQKRGNGIYTGTSSGKTDILDLAAVKNTNNYNKNDTTTNCCLDFNLSNKIDILDLAIAKNSNNYNKSNGSGPPCQ